jgi:hypothetical protein
LVQQLSGLRIVATAKGNPCHDESVDHRILRLISGEPAEEEKREN